MKEKASTFGCISLQAACWRWKKGTKKKIGFGELTGVYLSDGCSCDALFIQQFAVSFLNKSVSLEDRQLRYVWKPLLLLLLLLLHDLVCCLRNRQDSKLRRRVKVATKEVKAGWCLNWGLCCYCCFRFQPQLAGTKCILGRGLCEDHSSLLPMQTWEKRHNKFSPHFIYLIIYLLVYK